MELTRRDKIKTLKQIHKFLKDRNIKRKDINYSTANIYVGEKMSLMITLSMMREKKVINDKRFIYHIIVNPFLRKNIINNSLCVFFHYFLSYFH